ncbi:MAG TPA: hypothetical protein VJC05_03360 [Candidatus Andersenbacteria bacterium]|nr:hypothetical protein [Candidatus Andersenbacteria bacterium]
MQPKNNLGEVRQDLITGKWVLVAPGRAQKPSDFTAARHTVVPAAKYKADCPFCNVAEFPQEPDLLRLPDDPDQWQVHVFPNKYPALAVREEFRSWQVGPYRALEAVGYHELLATRWHHQIEAHLSAAEVALQLEALLLRYRQLAAKSAVNYIQIIKNHGEEAGASLAHPHQQIFALPVLPNDIQDLLTGAQSAAQRLGQDPFTAVLNFETQDGQRVVAENEFFLAFCPYASRFSFETWIVPRYQEPYFENTDPVKLSALAEMLQSVLARIYAGLQNPPFNYYLYSAPCDDTGFVCDRSTFDQFRWHVAIVPRLGELGGLELGTGVPVITTTPEAAARYLREARIGS